jgi:CTP:molybdopterin cytidylyltransferase MocA
MTLGAILLAAGEGRRIGGPKALLRIGGESFLARVSALLAAAGADPVVAVLGCEAARVRAEAGIPEGTIVVENPQWREGMLGSIWRGLDAVEAAGAAALLIHPVDHPLVEPQTIARVAGALHAGARIAVPSFSGTRGHPGGFAPAAWPALRAASPLRGARGVLADHPEWVVHVEGGPGCIAGIDTPADYTRLVTSP